MRRVLLLLYSLLCLLFRNSTPDDTKRKEVQRKSQMQSRYSRAKDWMRKAVSIGLLDLIDVLLLLKVMLLQVLSEEWSAKQDWQSTGN